MFDRACDIIGRNGAHLDFLFMGQMNLSEALLNRAECDVLFDHLQGYYGFISIEGIAQGLCVVNGCSVDCMRSLEYFFGKKPPFFVTDQNNFIRDLYKLDADVVSEYGCLGREFMENEWNGERNIARLIDYYRTL